MRILIVSDTYWPRINGVATSIDAFNRQFVAMGHEVAIFTTWYPGCEELDAARTDGVRIRRFASSPVPFMRSSEDRLVRRSEVPALRKAIGELAPDIVHVQTEFSLCEAASRYLEEKGLPYVKTCHTYYEEYIGHYFPLIPHFISALLVRNISRGYFGEGSHGLVVPSAGIARVLGGYGVRKEPAVIPTGLDKGDFPQMAERRESDDLAAFRWHPELKGRRILFSAGRLGKEKNFDFLIDSLTLVRRSCPAAVLVLAGTGPLRGELERHAREAGLSGHLLFVGAVPRERMREYYAAAEVFVFASRTETQGLVVIEAMMSGLPVVAVGAMGVAEVMGGDHGGFMCREDQGEFASRVVSLLDDPGLGDRKSREAIRHSEKWHIQCLAGRMLSLYESRVAENRAEKKASGEPKPKGFFLGRRGIP